MDPRQACLACLASDPPALFEAALWVAAEHDAELQPARALRELGSLQQRVAVALPQLPAKELAQLLLRQLSALDYREDDDLPLRPRAALLHEVLQRRRGQPLSLALIALELARRLEIPLQGVDFPGYFLLRVPGADHLLDPNGGRRLYTGDCRELLARQFGKAAELNAAQLATCDGYSLLQRLSRNLRQLHQQADDPLAALKDAERALLLGPPSVLDHLARADLYRLIDCPQGERYDLQRALLLSEDEAQRLAVSQRLRMINRITALH